jgi:hypothetical protein|tara:strand:+ start:2820 stop:3215 length:396 start_codon:yes stop_codon:yes gene_type:complete
MRFVKYLILGIIFSILPSCVSAQNQKVTWSKGDTVSTFYVCRTEKDIMEVALADVKGGDTLRQKVLKKTMTRDCLSLNSPLDFTVISVLGSYTDYDKKEVSILAISVPNEEEIAGYAIATGRPLLSKELTY